MEELDPVALVEDHREGKEHLADKEAQTSCLFEIAPGSGFNFSQHPRMAPPDPAKFFLFRSLILAVEKGVERSKRKNAVRVRFCIELRKVISHYNAMSHER